MNETMKKNDYLTPQIEVVRMKSCMTLQSVSGGSNGGSGEGTGTGNPTDEEGD